MYLSNTITFSQDFQISPLQNIFHAQPRVSEKKYFFLFYLKVIFGDPLSKCFDVSLAFILAEGPDSEWSLAGNLP